MLTPRKDSHEYVVTIMKALKTRKYSGCTHEQLFSLVTCCKDSQLVVFCCKFTTMKKINKNLRNDVKKK